MRPQEIARSLRERMEAKGWTQVALSKTTGVHQSQISRFKAGKFTQVSKNLRRVCEYAEVALEEVVVREEDEELRAMFSQLLANLDPTKRRALSAALRGILQLV